MLFSEMKMMADSILAKRTEYCCDGGWWAPDNCSENFECATAGVAVEFICTNEFICEDRFYCGNGGQSTFECEEGAFSCPVDFRYNH